ncbi:MlaC/ttg2D family ABC transporter substrate-binding protein [Lichenicoccus sp.]|uniref:MlaC/ttg2D family ABC transporter substrate-binding protein n=1 Tax=Lichenicoccus sp. TaxID=2781899 RepID=UPI003D0F9432
MHKAGLGVLALLALGGPTLRAATPAPGVVMESHDPAALFIVDVGRQFPTVLAGATTIAEKRRRLTPFISRVVDVPDVARFCLGQYWAKATPAQRVRYQALFLKSLVHIIAARMATYQGGLGHVVVERPVAGPEGTDVPTLVKGAHTPEVRVAWVVETDHSPMQVIDVVAEGMSLRLAKRSDFTAYLSRHDGDIDAFLDALQRQTDR